jgi:hypothetical protein
MLLMDDSQAQQLMDDLWQAGVRPTEGQGSAGQLKSTENHLKDMQDMSKQMLGVVLRLAERRC